MEHDIHKMNLNKEIARLTAELKKMDLEKTDIMKQIMRKEQNLPEITAELTAARNQAEQKKRALDQKSNNFHMASMAKIGLGTQTSQKSDFEKMAEKLAIDRELSAKEHEVERKTSDFKREIAEMKRKQYDVERRYDDIVAERRDRQRELEAIYNNEAMLKRAAEQKAKLAASKIPNQHKIEKPDLNAHPSTPAE